MRKNTERPITIEAGYSKVVGNDKEKILDAATKVLNGTAFKVKIPEKWDGKAAERIVDILLSSRGF